MAKGHSIIIMPENISEEEKAENKKRLDEVMKKIALHILKRCEEEGEENVLTPGCGVTITRRKR
ncbi:MAG: hypothetical protein ACRC1T_11780 [Clostridium chrysemydis]|uniref:hypothetical protein n=1 Tax=Clostridium TaxID=1485 RepID=UPI0021523B63|nr:hypothetical protein [Clostridium sp. LY3-2]MCR6516287.1 hypothetical protein [Clostridium sp. LY3-2]